MTGVVHLIGAGPGPADLLTLRAARLLAQADVVFHDALVSAEVLALAPQARRVCVGKRAGRPSTDQAFINRQIVNAARRHGLVVRLKGGDPMLFGRAHEEIEACRAADIAVEVTPGVSAAFAAAARLCASLSQRLVARSVVFVTPARARGATPDLAWADAAAAADTAAIYMGKADAGLVLEALCARGVPAATPVVLAESVARPDEALRAGLLADLPALAEQAGEGPALLLIGEAFAGALAAPHLADRSILRA